MLIARTLALMLAAIVASCLVLQVALGWTPCSSHGGDLA
jgi:hypothetical protein